MKYITFFVLNGNRTTKNEDSEKYLKFRGTEKLTF